MTSKKNKENLEELMISMINQLTEDLASQRRALLRTVIDPAEKYRCPYTGQTKTRKRTRVLAIEDSRVTFATRKALADMQMKYIAQIANLKRALRDNLEKDDTRDYSKKKKASAPKIDIEKLLQTGDYGNDETN